MIYVLRNPRTHKEIKVSRIWMVKLYVLNGYKLVDMYDPRQTRQCKMSERKKSNRYWRGWDEQ